MDHRLSGAPGLLCGETRASQVTGLSLTYVPRSITPPGGVFLAHDGDTPAAFRDANPLGTLEVN